MLICHSKHFWMLCDIHATIMNIDKKIMILISYFIHNNTLHIQLFWIFINNKKMHNYMSHLIMEFNKMCIYIFTLFAYYFTRMNWIICRFKFFDTLFFETFLIIYHIVFLNDSLIISIYLDIKIRYQLNESDIRMRIYII